MLTFIHLMSTDCMPGPMPLWKLYYLHSSDGKLKLKKLNVYRKSYKGHMTKSRGGCKRGREGGWSGVGWRDGEKMQATVIE